MIETVDEAIRAAVEIRNHLQSHDVAELHRQGLGSSTRLFSPLTYKAMDVETFLRAVQPTLAGGTAFEVESPVPPGAM